MYSGKSNWEQYREIFEAILCLNGWDDVTAALQLLAHLDGDALNIALLVPESQRAVPEFLINSLSDTIKKTIADAGTSAITGGPEIYRQRHSCTTTDGNKLPKR